MNQRNKFVKQEKLSVELINRERNLNQSPVVIWFTGLSGAGKTTLANGLEKRLLNNGIHSFLLDGDNVRLGLCKDLGFSASDRKENIRRVAEVALLFFESAAVTICSFVSPFNEDRSFARGLFPEGRFFEVFVKASIEDCEIRDTKGLYQLAREGKLLEFTGVSSPYEEPENPELIIDTTSLSVEESIEMLYLMIREKIRFEH
ncbi:MAG: adenylyl-sulfate kinase [Cytophagia bacterium]|nr:adenylyl-sulfate kinase [Cytophagia bacterium]